MILMLKCNKIVSGFYDEQQTWFVLKIIFQKRVCIVPEVDNFIGTFYDF